MPVAPITPNPATFANQAATTGANAVRQRPLGFRPDTISFGQSQQQPSPPPSQEVRLKNAKASFIISGIALAATPYFAFVAHSISLAATTLLMSLSMLGVGIYERLKAKEV